MCQVYIFTESTAVRSRDDHVVERWKQSFTWHSLKTILFQWRVLWVWLEDPVLMQFEPREPGHYLRQGGTVQIRKSRALKICPPLGPCALKFCTFGPNTLTCKFISRYDSSMCLTHHPKMTFHSRYIDERSGIALNGIWRVAAAKIFKGIF